MEETIWRWAAQLGFPVVVATGLAIGLHYWMRRAWAEVVIPLVSKAVQTFDRLQDHLSSVERDVHTLAEKVDALERKVIVVHARVRGEENT